MNMEIKEKSINEKENFLRAIEFRCPEWVPVIFELFPAVWKKYGKKLEEVVLRHPLIFSDYKEGQLGGSFDGNYPLFKENVRYEDDWGCVWYNAQDGNLGQVIEHPLTDWEAFNELKIPNPLKQLDWEKLKENTEESKRKGLPAIGSPESLAQGGFFDRLQFLRGLENLLIDLITDQPKLMALIEIVLDYNMKYINKWLEIGVDVMAFHGDIGTQNGLLFSPEIFRKYLKPAYAEMFQTCRQAGTHVWYSSDGNILEIVDDLIECGVSIHDPQVRANTIESIAKVYKGKLCALVDIDEQMLPFCTPEDINQQIKEVVEKVGSSEGGLMIYAIPSQDVPLENIEALLTALEKHCFLNRP
jgi:uroporphyrinogen decarboxylase